MPTTDRTLLALLRYGFDVVDAFSRRVGADLRRLVSIWPLTRETRPALMLRIDAVLDRAFGLTKRAALTGELFRTILTSTDRAGIAPFEALWSRMERAVERNATGVWQTVCSGILRRGPESTDPLARTLAQFERDRAAFLRKGKLDANRIWVKGDGTPYRLSDRIWKQGREMRRTIDYTIREGIRTGQTIDAIAARIEGYVVPGVEGQAARHARLLVQGETTHMYHAAEEHAASVAPDVVGLRWELSASHELVDVCNSYAEADGFDLGPGGYPPREVPMMPHPRCGCRRGLIFRSDLKLADHLISTYA
ncbi:MAG: hypothetical protein ACR2OU_04490 [Thermomicrobiales bacterium]